MKRLYEIDCFIARIYNEVSQVDDFEREARCTLYKAYTAISSEKSMTLIFYDEKFSIKKRLDKIKEDYENFEKQLTLSKFLLNEPVESYYSLYPEDKDDRVSHWLSSSCYGWFKSRSETIFQMLFYDYKKLSYLYSHHMLRILKVAFTMLNNDCRKIGIKDLFKKKEEYRRVLERLQDINGKLIGYYSVPHILSRSSSVSSVKLK